jgi:diguanylate cyclase (GGDEF)-like protein/PAS domain S-box-containing protein
MAEVTTPIDVARPDPPKVLIAGVDDTERSRLVDMLDGRGYDIAVAATAAEVRSRLTEVGADVVVVDAALGAAGGCDGVASLFGHQAELSVLLVTDPDVTGAEVSAAGAIEQFLVRPVSPAIVVAAVRRAVDRRQAERVNRRRATQAQKAADFARTLAGTKLDPTQLFESVVQAVCRAIGDAAGLFVLSEDGASLSLAAIHHDDVEARQVIVDMFRDEPHPAMTGLLGRAIASHDTVLLPDIPEGLLRQLYGATRYDRFYERFPLRSLIAAPLTARGVDLGLLAVIRSTSTVPYDEADALFVEDLAERAALALHGAQLLVEAERNAAVLRGVFDTAADGIIVIDEVGEIQMTNDATSALFGYREDELIGHNVATLMFEADRVEHGGNLQRYLRTGQGRIIGSGRDVEGRRQDGTPISLHLSVSEIKSPARMFTGILHDITDRKRAERQLREAAVTDPLTGLPNRSAFLTQLEAAVARVDQQPIAVLFIDLDGFKVVNDTYGHDVGDAVLGAVAKRLDSCTRAVDLVARWGGDEFAVISRCNGPDEVERLVERLRASFHQPVAVAAGTYSVGATIGVAHCPGDGVRPEDLMGVADQRMYAAKAKDG